MSFAACARPSVVAFCVFHNTARLPPSFPTPRQSRSVAVTVSGSQSFDRDPPFGDAHSSPSPPRSSEKRDWFSDGRDAAQQLKLDLGIVGGDERGNPSVHLSKADNFLGEKIKGSASYAILESGRAAALELLRDMNSEEENSSRPSPSPASPSSTGSSRTTSDNDRPSAATDDHFSVPSRKSHCTTVCLVPPPSATEAWERLAAVRRECRDPGYFRWPPHANLLYPFLEPATGNKGDNSEDGNDEGGNDEDGDGPPRGARFRAEVATRLKKAAERCEPFDVTIDAFGTFGDRRRGVLWADPKSHRGRGARDEGEDDAEEAPLIRLHGLLEEQFPACKEPRKAAAAFRPHMTVSHYESAARAAAAGGEIRAKWEPVSFHVPEIYVLERRGDGGQFEIAATVPLGAGAAGPVEFHDPPVAFPAMPEEEEGWVREARTAMKKRRKDGFRRRKKRRGEAARGSSQETSL